MEKKNLKIHYGNDLYLGDIFFAIYVFDDSNSNKENFLKELKKIYLKDNFLRCRINGADVMDFIDKLQNKENGDELYQNVIKNIEFVKKMQNKAYEIEMSDEFDWTVYRIDRRDENWEEFTLFKDNNILSYLYNEKDFKEWFKKTMLNENDTLWSLLFNKYKEESIKLKKEHIKMFENLIKSNEESTKDAKMRIAKLQEEIKLLEEKK